MGRSTTYLVLDTNILLHFKRPDETDWRRLVGAQEVELVFVVTVLRELDSHKVQNPKRRLRDRATSVLKWLSDIARAKERVRIRDGVNLSVRTTSPLLDFPSHGLRKDITDDEIVASLLELKVEHEGCAVRLVTNDTGMRFSAEGHGIDVFCPPEEYRLPEEPDPVELENKQLKAQLHEYKSREPNVTVVPRGPSQSVQSVYVELPAVEQVSEEAVLRAVEGAKFEAYGIRETEDSYLGDFDFDGRRERALNHVHQRASEKQNEMLQLQAARQHRARTVPVALTLVNQGTATASDVDVEFKTSDDGAWRFSDSDGADPGEPVLAGPHDAASQQSVGPGVRAFEHPMDLAPVAITPESVRFHCDSLKPSNSVRLTPLFVSFPARERVRPFELEYTVSCAEGRRPVAGRVPVVVSVAPSSASLRR